MISLPSWRWLTVGIGMSLALTACRPTGTVGDDRAPATTPVDVTSKRPGLAAPVTLYVSNQSFEDPSVRITIVIDGIVKVDQVFDVEGQHNWIDFEFGLAPGSHSLTAISHTGATMETEFLTEAGVPRWAVVDSWWYPDEGPRRFTFMVSDEPVAFM